MRYQNIPPQISEFAESIFQSLSVVYQGRHSHHPRGYPSPASDASRS